MNINVEYMVGAKVYYQHFGPVREDCGFCDSTGTITGKNGINIACPICKGRGYVEPASFVDATKPMEMGVIEDIILDWQDPDQIRIFYTIDGVNIDQREVQGVYVEPPTPEPEPAPVIED